MNMEKKKVQAQYAELQQQNINGGCGLYKSSGYKRLARAADQARAFPTVYECEVRDEGRKRQTVVSDLDGTLLRGNSSFPYFMALAWEASGPARFGLLLALAPAAWVLYHLVSEEAAIRLLIFVSCAGVPEASLLSAARAALPKLYLDDVHPATWRVFSSFGRRCVLTANPRFMVEPFACEFLGADLVIGSELEFTASRVATGFVKPPGVAVGRNKLLAMERHFGDDAPDVGLGDRPSDYPFMSVCKEGYVVPRTPKVDPIPQHELPKPIIFHDGRLVKKPTPLWALAILIWMPIGFILALIRVAAGALLPMSIVYYAFWALGVRVVVKGTPPPPVRKGSNEHGVLFVCTHKTLLDPIFISCALGRPVSAVTYSLSRVSELISPIRTVRLSRDRETDAANIKKLLKEGDLVICPEGTTCREPFLLRFSALFAELTDHIVPVAMNNRMGMFHATTARGWKGMDCFYFFMNPSPMYEITFLRELPKDLTCAGGKTSFEVANYIQKVLAATLNFECTSFTRKDKYKALAGNDGSVSPPKH